MIFEETVYDERNGLDTISLALKDLYVNFVITFFFFFFRSYPECLFEQNLCALFSISGTFSLIIVHSYTTISATIVAQLMILDASKASRLQCSEDQVADSCLLSNLDNFSRAFVVQ